VGLLLYLLLARRWGVSAQLCCLWSTLGYATHGLLDGCTSWGTMLLWPLSDHRFAWDLVSVVDGAFTIPILALVGIAIWRRKKKLIFAAIGWAAFYLVLASVQHWRALEFGEALARERGHPVDRLSAKPSFGNIVVWKIIYQSGDRYFVDAVSLGPFEARLWPGRAIDKLNVQQDFPWLEPTSQQAKDIERFAKFSDGYLAVDPNNPLRIGDIRYSLLPHQVDPLWGIALSRSAGPEQHVEYYTQRDGSREALPILWRMIIE